MNDKSQRSLLLTEASKHANRPVGYIPLVRGNPNYRSLWFGETISLFGDWFNLIASAALISQLTGSGLAVGALFVIRMIAPFLVSPIAGVSADRYNRKRLLILLDLSRAIVVLGFLFVRDTNQIWLLYSLTALQLAISGFFYPTRNALLPDIVSRNELGTANALSSGTWSVMLALGAAVGGIVAGQWGIYPAFVIDSLTFLLSAFFINRIRYITKSSPNPSETSLRNAHRQYINGLRYITRHIDVLLIVLHKGAFALIVGGAFQVIQVILAEQQFVIGEGGGTSLGILYAVGGVGTGIGPIFLRRFTGDRNRPLQIAIALSYLIVALGLSITAPLIGFGFVILGTFFRAFGGGVNWVFSTQVLLQTVSDDVRGRVFSTEFAIFTLSSALGAGVGGWLIDNTSITLSAMIWMMTVIILIPGVLWATWIAMQKENPSAISESAPQVIDANESTAYRNMDTNN